jgi:hypothetical protein
MIEEIDILFYFILHNRLYSFVGVIYGLNAKILHIRMILSREDGKALICTLTKRISRAGQKEGKFKFLQCQDPRQGKQGRGSRQRSRTREREKIS